MILRRCPTLRHLDGAAVNEDERKSVLTALKKLEARKDEENRQVLMKARREQTLISLKEKFFSLHPQLRLEDPSFEQVLHFLYYIYIPYMLSSFIYTLDRRRAPKPRSSRLYLRDIRR